ncbi:MAG: hypothetical protein J6A69_11265 [Clostridia bacterium]|nr:hypothetical protein [Clostridia bacterium]
MNNKVFCIIPILMTTSYALIRINNQECGNDMNFFLDTILPIIITAVLSGTITYFVSSKLAKKSQIIKNTEEIQKLARQLGVNDKETFHSEFTKQYETIIGNIGRGDKATLTAQHDDLRNMLQKEINVAERRYTEEEKRIRNFTAEQHNMTETIEDFKLFIES